MSGVFELGQHSWDNLRSKEALESFVAYCEANPEQRFWQALMNWSDRHIRFMSEFDANDEYVGKNPWRLEGLDGINVIK